MNLPWPNVACCLLWGFKKFKQLQRELCLDPSWPVCQLGFRESILVLDPNHRWHDYSADTVAWKANSWQRHPWHAETWWEPLLWANGQLYWLSSHSGLLSQSVFSLPRGKKIKEKKVGGLVCFIKVPSVCLHEGSSPPSVCWHHTEFCPLPWLLSEPRRHGQVSRWHRGKLGFLSGELSFHVMKYRFFNSITGTIT